MTDSVSNPAVVSSDPTVAEQFGMMRPLALRLALAAWGFGALCGIARLAITDGSLDLGSGADLWVRIIYSHWMLANVVLLLVLVGRRLLDLPLLNSADMRGLSAVGFQFAAGTWATTFLLLIIGLITPLGPAAIAATLAAMVAFAWPQLRSFVTQLKDDEQAMQQSASIGIGVLGIMLAAIIWLTPLWVRTLLPASNWDTLMYHLPLAEQFAQHGVWQVDPLQEGLTFPAVPHLLYAVFMSTGAPEAIMPFNLLISVACALTAYAAAAHYADARAGWFAALIVISTQLIFELGIDARIDNFLVLFALLSVDAFCRWDRDAHKPGWLIVSGMALGLTMGTKYSAAILLLIMALPVLWLSIARLKMPEARIARALPIALLCVALPAGFWYARNAVVLGDPVYPELSQRLYETPSGSFEPITPVVESFLAKEPPIPPEKIEGDWPAFGASLFNWYTIIFEDYRHARGPLHRLSPFLLLVLLLPLVAWRSRTAWWLLGAALLYYLAVAPQTGLVRYLAPAIGPAAIGAAIALSAICARARWRYLPASLVVLIVAVIARNWVGQFDALAKEPPLLYLTGMQRAAEWQCKSTRAAGKYLGCMVDFINTRVADGRIAPDSRILMLTEARGFQLDLDYTPDCRSDAAAFIALVERTDHSTPQIAAELKQQGYTHIVVFLDHAVWVQNRRKSAYPQLYVALQKLFQFMRDGYGDVVFTTDNQTWVIELTTPEQKSSSQPAADAAGSQHDAASQRDSSDTREGN